MRPAEWISVTFYTVFLVAAVFAPLQRTKRLKALGIGVVGLLAAWLAQFLEAVPAGGVLRDLLPGLFLLIGYWQTGQFFSGSNPSVEGFLRRFDERWFPGVARIASSLDERRALATYLEAAYLACYPVVPLGVGVLYLAGQSHAIDQFWMVVLPPSFACYASTAVFRSLPPWLLDTTDSLRSGRSDLRSLNHWVLRHASIRANTLPSGHVANSFAIAFVLLKLVPIAGLVFLWIAVSIAFSTVILRYHFSLDAVLGVAIAILSFSLFA